MIQSLKNAKSVTVKTNKAVVKKLKAGKYYVKVRSFTTENNMPCQLDWSAIKSVQVK